MWLFIFRVVCVIPYHIFEDGASGEPEEGRLLPIMAYRESTPTPERDTVGVFRLHVYEREEI